MRIRHTVEFAKLGTAVLSLDGICSVFWKRKGDLGHFLRIHGSVGEQSSQQLGCCCEKMRKKGGVGRSHRLPCLQLLVIPKSLRYQDRLYGKRNKDFREMTGKRFLKIRSS